MEQSMKNLLETPFVNEFNQTINVGDEVIVVTMSTKCLGINKGTYLGITDSKRVQVKVPTYGYKWYLKETNEPFDYYKSNIPYHEKLNIAYAKRELTGSRIITLINNKIYPIK